MITSRQVWECINYATRLAMIAGFDEDAHIPAERLARTQWCAIPLHTREAIHDETSCKDME